MSAEREFFNTHRRLRKFAPFVRLRAIGVAQVILTGTAMYGERVNYGAQKF
jgi:hypothetical protein